MTDFSESLAKRKQYAAELADGYSPMKQAMEYGSVAAFALLFGYNTVKLASYTALFAPKSLGDWTSLVAFVGCVLSAILTADFASGLVHWFMDTWGTVDMPVIGKTFIRSFREHHLAPAAMTKHSLTETNGDNCLLTLPVLLSLARSDVVLSQSRLSLANPAVNAYTFLFTMFLVLFVCLTNQIHKWSHMHAPSPPPHYVRVLQKMHIILPPKHHNAHHTAPFDRYYCITTGWLNAPLEKLHFWRILETAITAATGQQPRLDDKKWTAQ